MHHHHIANCIQFYTVRDRMTFEPAERGILIGLYRLILQRHVVQIGTVCNGASCSNYVGVKAHKEMITFKKFPHPNLKYMSLSHSA